MDHAADEHARPRLAIELGWLARAPRPLAASVLLGLSVVIWALSLSLIDLERMTDIGLIAALPPTFFSAVFLLTASFVVAVVSRCFALVPLQVAVQILMFYGTTSIVEYGPRSASAWRVAGIVDQIVETRSIDRGIDVFFNWPGFFIVVAFVTGAAGLSSALGLAEWAPLAFNLAFAVPLFVIFRALVSNERQVWVALWLFFAANWVGQDYLAPQAFAYLIHLIILALLLTVFPGAEREKTEIRDPAQVARQRRQRVGAVALALVLYALIVPSHQLTPWMVTLSVAALVLVKRLPSFGLPLVMAVIATTWVVFFAGPYLAGHFGDVAEPVGSVASNLDANLGGRFEGSDGHLLVLQLRVVFSGLMGALAIYGLLRMRSVGAPVRTIAALGIAPFVMLGFQSYGGELLLRIFLFALPFIALLGAAAFTVASESARTLRVVAAAIVVMAIPIGFFTVRYGNEKTDTFTQSEIGAIDYVYATAPKGAWLVAAYNNVPWQFSHYTDYRYQILDPASVSSGSVADVLGELKGDEPTYLVLTRSQTAAATLFQAWDDDALSQLRTELLRSNRFTLVFSNPDASVLRLRADTTSIPKG